MIHFVVECSDKHEIRRFVGYFLFIHIYKR